MTTFAVFKSVVYTNIGRDSSDVTAALVVPKAVNYAVDLAAVLFKPVELSTTADLTLNAGNTSVQMTSKFIDIIVAKITTDTGRLWFIPFELFDFLLPSISTIKYFTILGDYIYVNTSSGSTKTIRVTYTAHPAELTSESSEPEFTQHDAFIIAAATAFCFAVLEEADSADMWSKIGEMYGIGLLKSAMAKEIVSGALTSLESTITGALTGSK